MFKPDKMSEISLIIKDEDLREVTDLLHDLKLIEFFEINNNDFNKYEHEDLNELSQKLLKIRSCITILKEFHTNSRTREVENPLDNTLKLKEDLDKYEKELVKLSDEVKRKRILDGLKVTKEEINSKEHIIGFIPKFKSRTLKVFNERKIKYRTYEGNKRIYFIAKTNKVPFGFKEFYLPSSFSQSVNKKFEETQKHIENIKIKLTKLSNYSLENLRVKEHKLRKEIELRESKPKFLKTRNIAIISGFVPTKNTHHFERELKYLIGDNYELEIKDAKENAPTKLSNPPVIDSFSELLKMYSLPKYGEFDPTIISFLMFPLFFGFILGDVIYGLLSLLLFTFLKQKFTQAKGFMTILQISSISSIIFGIIFGEFMGYEFHGTFYGLFARSHNPETLLLYAVIFGIIHINMGLIIGFVNALPNIKKAIYDKAAWILLQFGIGFLAYGINSNSQILTTLGAVIGVISAFLIYKGHGFIGIIEMPSFFTNILSYARLMAVGLSSVVIAILINEFTETFFSMGFFGIIAGVLLFTLGHTFNIFLGNFEGFLHSLRLHYVEFFTKFYEGGGREFTPFGHRKLEE